MKITGLMLCPRWLPGLMAALALFSGCGGGVGEGGTGGGSYAQGPINGFGSVIVNDVRYDDSAAQVLDADGSSRSSADLRLGMTVEVDSSTVTQTISGPTASATRIRYASELLGPLTAVDSANSRFALLGQTVQVSSSTVFDERLSGGLAALAAGQLVEVYAAFDPASASYRATRVEPRSSATAYGLRGVVAQLDATAKTLRIGTASFAYAGASAVPSALADGAFVRLQLQPAAAGSGSWTVLSFGSGTNTLLDGRQARVKGLISAFTSTVDFSVNGQRIDGASASFPDGTAGLLLGARVEVEGSAQGGVLRATQVTIESDVDEHTRGFDLRGTITVLDTALKTFVLRGMVVSYAGTTVVFKNGTAADLAPNRRVEVKAQLAAGGITLVATEVTFDN